MFTPEMLMEALAAHYDRLRAFELDRARKMLAAGQPAHVAMEALSRRLIYLELGTIVGIYFRTDARRFER